MRRRVLAVALIAVGLSACTSRTSTSDMLAQQRSLAAALSSLDSRGASFTISTTITDVQGQQTGQLTFVGTGVLKNDDVHMNLNVTTAQGKGPLESIIYGGTILNRTSPSEAWSSNYLPEAWVPSVRPALAREAVLLSAHLGSAVFTHVSAGFVDKHPITLAPAQLEELSGILVAGSSETDFLRTASGELDLYTAWRSDTIKRIEVRYSYINPTNSTRRTLDSSIDISGSAVRSVPIPGDFPIQPTPAPTS